MKKPLLSVILFMSFVAFILLQWTKVTQNAFQIPPKEPVISEMIILDTVDVTKDANYMGKQEE